MLYIVILVTVGMHRSPTSQNWSVTSIIIAAGLWALDRIIRMTRFLYNGAGSTAAVTPLPGGGTRSRLRKAPANFVPGKHAFL